MQHRLCLHLFAHSSSRNQPSIHPFVRSFVRSRLNYRRPSTCIRSCTGLVWFAGGGEPHLFIHLLACLLFISTEAACDNY